MTDYDILDIYKIDGEVSPEARQALNELRDLK